MKRITQSALALTVLATLSLAAHAESTFQSTTGSGALNATARVDFRINIPRIGTGTLFGSNAAVDLIDFNVPAADVGNGTAVAATAGSGDLGNGVVTARVRGNGGSVGLTATTGGALSNGAGGTGIAIGVMVVSICLLRVNLFKVQYFHQAGQIQFTTPVKDLQGGEPHCRSLN